MTTAHTGITRFQAENIKRLRAVSITPEGNLIGIGGRNGQGKTSVIDSIAMALGGKKLVPSKPIRDGEAEARVEVDVDGYKIIRTFTEKGSYLTVKNGDGAKYTNGQEVLDGLVGSLSFDPLAFTRMDGKKQAETLRELLGIDTAEIEKKRAEAYEARRIENAAVRECESQLRGIAEHEGVGTEEVSVTTLIDKLNEATAHNQRHQSLGHEIHTKMDRANQMRAELDALENDIGSLRCRFAEMDAEMDLEPLREQINGIEETNRKARENAQRLAIAERQRMHAINAEAENAEIIALDAEKAEMLREAQYPIEGLGIDDEGRVTYGGIPFDQASAAEQVRVSVAIGLAMNPKLRIVLIRDGSLLDRDSLALIAEMAEQHDAQVWIERVGEGEECQVIIEDGSVKVAAATNGGAS